MDQLNYAESWLWIHFLLESSPENAQLVQGQLARLRMTGETIPLSEEVDEQIENWDRLLIDHLAMLADEL